MYNMYYLSHHGIQGQRWGVRNGPPYPIVKGRPKHTRSEKQVSSRDNGEDSKSMKKTKQQAIAEASASDILKYIPEMSDAELRSALNRVQWAEQIRKATHKDVSSGFDKIDKIFEKVGTVGGWFSGTANLINSIVRIIEGISKMRGGGNG